MTLSTSLVIATYNWKRALAAVLATVRTQWELPTEVVIADDGSGADTADMIERETLTFPVPLRHVRHEDLGFRLGMIRNKAIAVAIGDYVLQIDGDMLLHPAFVRGHRRHAKRGWYVQGSRAMLGAVQSRRCLAACRLVAGPLHRGVTNRLNGIYAPLLAHAVRGPADPLTRTRGCHMAFWRDDLVRVNGYNEDLEGWGREDSELAARLVNAGVRRRNLKFAAVAWHLHHRAPSRDAEHRHQAIFDQVFRDRITRCMHGLDRHLAAVDSASSRER